jgi:phosphate transport system permease protein
VFVKYAFFTAAFISVCVTVSMVIFMIVLGLPLFREGLFLVMLRGSWNPSSGAYGIFPMILGTLSIAFLALLLGFPMSLGTAALMSGLAPGFLRSFLRKTVQAMTGIPTVVYGFVGVFLLVPLVRGIFGEGSGMCVLSAALLLSVLISPVMILTFADSFGQVPESSRTAAAALGATPVQTFLYVVLPASGKGLVTGLILGLGRAMGDTMIALMVSGNAIGTPDSILSPARTLTAHIALVIAADFKSPEFRTLFLCGIVLYGFTAVSAIAVRTLDRLFAEAP